MPLSMILPAIWSILCESAVFILVGFLLAGLMDAALTTARVVPLLSGRRARSVLWATLIGLPLPLCSCGVLPAALTLRRRGASRGAVVSFLISTPETSVTSVLLTYALLGPVMAVFRPLAACITAVAAGLIENALSAENGSADLASKGAAHTSSLGGLTLPIAGQAATMEPSCCTRGETSLSSTRAGSLPQRLAQGMDFAFVRLFDDIFAWVLVGIAAAAVIQVWLPPDALQRIAGGPLQSSLLMVLIGVPLYVCAEASTPVAAVLIAQGLNPGAALVFLLVGPATNIGSLGVLRRELGTRSVAAYLVTIIIIALFMGGVLNDLLANAEWNLAVHPLHESFVPAWLKIAAAILFLILGIGTATRQNYAGRMSLWLNAWFPVRVTPKRLMLVLPSIALVVYVVTGVHVIRAGEVGIVRRFGAVHPSALAPGLHLTWPRPIDRVDRVAAGEVRRLELGFRSNATPGDLPNLDLREGWQLVGDENIADVECVVHWGAEPTALTNFRFAVEESEALVRGVVLAAMNEVLGGLRVERVLTSVRGEAEREIESIARRRLQSYGSGIRIDAVRLIDAHAPPEVHAAFRDLASAVEDRTTYVNQARAAEARIVPLARSEAVQSREQAQAEATKWVRAARGEADRFVALLQAYSRSRHVTALRLELEALEMVLPGLRKYIRPPAEMGADVEVWFLEQGELKRAQPFMGD